MKKGYVDAPLGQIHYRRQGAGDPVVLIGHAGRSSRMHDPLMRALAPEFDVISFDLPGTGESCPLHPSTSYEAIAESFVACLDSLNVGPVHVYGIHTGNKMGAAMGARHPSLVRSLVLAGQSHSIVPNQVARNDSVRRVAASAVHEIEPPSTKQMLDWIGKLAEIGAFGLSRKVLLDIVESGNYEWPLALIVDELQALGSRPALYAGNFAYDLERDLGRLIMPTLVLEIATPAEDKSIGRQGPALLSLLKNGALVTWDEPDGYGITLEHRAHELAEILSRFFSAAGV